MRAGKKIAKKLADRIERWEKLPGTGSANNVKIVQGIGTGYRKPGSQNRRKAN